MFHVAHVSRKNGMYSTKTMENINNEEDEEEKGDTGAQENTDAMRIMDKTEAMGISPVTTN